MSDEELKGKIQRLINGSELSLLRPDPPARKWHRGGKTSFVRTLRGLMRGYCMEFSAKNFEAARGVKVAAFEILKQHKKGVKDDSHPDWFELEKLLEETCPK